ncbi:hypothetical protein NMG60_11004633 [Bertholletia excelsa]
MECNKDEAARAKRIAEEKLKESDISGAKRFAVKAQSLFPGLEGLRQLVAILDVYIAAEKKINGEVDCYGILGVGPFADDGTLRRHYRKLALLLHPDKNKSAGAEGAFKILSEAWSLLSDRAKKRAYDQKLNLSRIFQKNTTSNTSMPAGRNGLYAFNSQGNPRTTSISPQSSKLQSTSVPPHPPKANTFWTLCNFCKMQYEYLRDYINQNLRCPNCQQPFHAVEMPAPPTTVKNSPTPWTSYQKQQNVNCHTINNLVASERKPIFSPNVNHCIAKDVLAAERKSTSSPNAGMQGAAGSGSSSRPVPEPASSTGQNKDTLYPSFWNLKKGHEEAQTAVVGEEAAQQRTNISEKIGSRPSKKSRIEMSVGKREMPYCKETENVGANRVHVSGYQDASGAGRVNIGRESLQLKIRKLLMAKSQKEIQKKLHEWSTESAQRTSNKEGEELEMEKAKAFSNNAPKASVNGGKKDGKTAAFIETKRSVLPQKSLFANDDSNEKSAEAVLMSVPDPEFYDFDKDRIEKSFGENQVWAAYDDDDGMPRYYALIHGVVSKRPFKMEISWLNSKSNAELGPLNWVGSGFSKTSGDFRVGKHALYKNINAFSHRVKWNKGIRGAIQIFPKKGDVWAIYRNWSPEWNELTPDDVIHKYDMVEVIEDYKEDHGVVVAPLVKVAGFKSVFQRHLDSREVKTIPREEMFRLSHPVPSYILTGQEAPNAPKNCWELDPAAMPLELLQVMREEKVTGTVEKVKKENVVMTYVRKAKRDLHSGQNSKGTIKEKETRNAKETKEERMMKNTNTA